VLSVWLASGRIDIRRFPRLRGLVVGIASTGLFTAVLAGAASPRADAATGAPVSTTYLPGPGAGVLRLSSHVRSWSPTALTTPRSGPVSRAHRNGSPAVLAPVTSTPLVSGDPLPPIGPNATPVQLKVRFSPPPYAYGVYPYSCKATDGTQSTTATASLTALDQPTFVHTPGFPYPSGTADATDTATLSYPTITGSEALTGRESDARTNDATFNGCVPVAPGPTSATSGDVPPSSPVAPSRTGSPPSTALPATTSMPSLA
jgi:hypothetical protein